MKTVLYDTHCALGAKMVDFAGWMMPVQYQGILAEHNAVRHHAGIFDVSHMGRVVVTGPDSEKFLDYLCTNTIVGKQDGTATYTVLAEAAGGSVDDVIVYKWNAESYFVICNASNRGKDLQHMQEVGRAFDVQISDRFAQEGILSIQGPAAMKIVAEIFPQAAQLKPMHFCEAQFNKETLIVSATGYTGEKGVEIYASNPVVNILWEQFLSLGAVPVGLGARDTLRLEMGYALYGHELSDTIAATESVSAWTVKWNKDFLGKEALKALENSPEKRSEHGVVLLDPGVARAGYEVVHNGKVIGSVTSGTHSPTLNQSIAIVLVKAKLKIDDVVEIKIRSQLCKAKVVDLPFVIAIGS